jgi:hypothetical protein
MVSQKVYTIIQCYDAMRPIITSSGGLSYCLGIYVVYAVEVATLLAVYSTLGRPVILLKFVKVVSILDAVKIVPIILL